MSSPPLRSLAAVFLRHGNMTFGAGSATIATLHREIITKRGWVTQRQSDLTYALSRLTPGTNLLAFSERDHGESREGPSVAVDMNGPERDQRLSSPALSDHCCAPGLLPSLHHAHHRECLGRKGLTEEMVDER
jgi:Chromate transporter